MSHGRFNNPVVAAMAGLKDFFSKQELASRLTENDRVKLDITILNASVALPKARKTASGLEEMFLVNYLSNVILTNLLLTKNIIDIQTPGKEFLQRIIFISSDSHQGSSYIDYEEFGKHYEYGPSKGISNYSYFKLILNTYATELSKRRSRWYIWPFPPITRAKPMSTCICSAIKRWIPRPISRKKALNYGTVPLNYGNRLILNLLRQYDEKYFFSAGLLPGLYYFIGMQPCEGR